VLRSLKDLQRYTLWNEEGRIGSLHSFLFDDENLRIIRYLVVDTGEWLHKKRVLLSPLVINDADWALKKINVTLTKDQIRKCPDIDVHKSISRKKEEEYLKFYKLPIYWQSVPPPPPPATVKPIITPETPSNSKTEEKGLTANEGMESYLRSSREVIGYHVEGRDGEIGTVNDLIADDREWIIQYMVVDTGEWLSGKNILISPYWIERISWEETKVCVDLFRKAVKDAPEYDPSQPVNREYEAILYDYYGRPRYWANDL
jgi:hypothetical protein